MTKNEAIDSLVEEFRRDLEESYDNIRRKYITGNGTRARFEYYASIVSEYFNIPKDTLLSKSTRKREYTYARKLLWFICRTGKTSIPYSFSALGENTGGYNHATVLYGIRTTEELLDYDNTFRFDAKTVISSLEYSLEKQGRKWTIK
jgi:chromosomal replication initiation ATPase DnaA